MAQGALMDTARIFSNDGTRVVVVRHDIEEVP
jgi:hypothetical protein